jgi:NAD(P)-dependent dehydrogenase (short-subunit alcohol dehydrogenase family)
MKVALVTGANRGIGLEVCRQLSDLGYHVILTARNAEAGQTAAARLRVEYRPLDVSEPESVASLVEKVRERHGKLDVLVNNAGVSLKGFDYKVVKDTLAVNFFGALAVTDAFLPVMNDRGRIVMVSSAMGELACLGLELSERFASDSLNRQDLNHLMNKFAEDVAFEHHLQKGWPSSAYRVSKVGLNALVRVLDRELKEDPRDLRVNAVDPGWVRTEMGGTSAPKELFEGADSIVWLAKKDDENSPKGAFFRERQSTKW